MGLKEQITEDMKAAMRAKEAGKLGTIRLIIAEIKQRKDSITQFEAGNRPDLADIEKAELAVLVGYMPAGLSDEQIAAEVAAAVAASGAAGPQDMGKVMAIVKPKMPKGTDMGAVSALIKKALTPA